MPLQNRVDPWGVLRAVDARGTLMGNRGGALHDDERRIVRDHAFAAWIICVTEFKGRRQPLMVPGHYTQLFFLDEATALAAGHRPCFLCRRPEATRFVDLWRRICGRRDVPLSELDAALNAERRLPRSRSGTGKRAYQDQVGNLPDSTVVELDGDAWLVACDELLRWSFDGYTQARPKDGDLTGWVLTPPTTVRVLRAGYRPVLHHTAAELAGSASAEPAA